MSDHQYKKAAEQDSVEASTLIIFIYVNTYTLFE